MTEIGGVFTKPVSLSAQSFTSVFAPTGEQIKITMAHMRTGNGTSRNSSLFVAPNAGPENDVSRGITSDDDDVPPIGGNASFGSGDAGGAQPIFITDSEAVHLGNTTGATVTIALQGVRVA